ncbi:MAG: hypothetical protein KKD73_10745 [Proteobacteria bacterium]|nr:hypothetical protein [Pseudomonadota bacterium]MBU1641158.1 hypothetical protein [Pseudomonadota bacterium]
MTQYLILLAIIPLSVFNLTKMFMPRRRWLLSGFATGLVIAPVSMGLIEFTYVPIIGKALGLVGVVGNLIHGSVGYFFLVSFGGMEPGVLLSASQLVTISLVNAAIWGSYYGMVGYNIDGKLATEEKPAEVHEGHKVMKQRAV